jgi:hypothetical protein
MFPAGSIIVDATRRHATSAQPAAPVERDAEPARGRTVLAAALRGPATRADRAARRIEPRPVPALNQ